MISYAQNFEDVILDRIFKGQASGFYVDIGACHPVYDSVTYHFYLKGWKGINVEPQPTLFSELEAVRERDTNLRMCVGAQAGQETLYITRDVGTSTLNRSIAESYRKNLSVEAELTVELITLDQIWSQHVGARQVDFMKIDVEGFEKEVLSGANFATVAPSILVIEATTPNSQELCYDEWEALILEYYDFFYFDGVNRFYVREGYLLEKAIFSIPPNVFDQFKVFPHVLVEQANESLVIENQALKKQLHMSRVQLSRKDEALDDAGNAYANLQSEYQTLHQQLELAANSVSDYQVEITKAQQTYESLQTAYGIKEKDLLDALGFLRAKENALAHASEAYEFLQAAFSRSQQEVINIGGVLHATKDSCEQAADAYGNLRTEFEQKMSELTTLERILEEKEGLFGELHQTLAHIQTQLQESYDRQRESDQVLSEATAYCASIAIQFQRQDDVPVDVVQTYQILKEKFDEAILELGKLHERLSR